MCLAPAPAIPAFGEAPVTAPASAGNLAPIRQAVLRFSVANRLATHQHLSAEASAQRGLKDTLPLVRSIATGNVYELCFFLQLDPGSGCRPEDFLLHIEPRAFSGPIIERAFRSGYHPAQSVEKVQVNPRVHGDALALRLLHRQTRRLIRQVDAELDAPESRRVGGAGPGRIDFEPGHPSFSIPLGATQFGDSRAALHFDLPDDSQFGPERLRVSASPDWNIEADPAGVLTAVEGAWRSTIVRLSNRAFRIETAGPEGLLRETAVYHVSPIHLRIVETCRLAARPTESRTSSYHLQEPGKWILLGEDGSLRKTEHRFQPSPGREQCATTIETRIHPGMPWRTLDVRESVETDFGWGWRRTREWSRGAAKEELTLWDYYAAGPGPRMEGFCTHAEGRLARVRRPDGAVERHDYGPGWNRVSLRGKDGKERRRVTRIWKPQTGETILKELRFGLGWHPAAFARILREPEQTREWRFRSPLSAEETATLFFTQAGEGARLGFPRARVEADGTRWDFRYRIQPGRMLVVESFKNGSGLSRESDPGGAATLSAFVWCGRPLAAGADAGGDNCGFGAGASGAFSTAGPAVAPVPDRAPD
ncbi:MAG TPA: hypothetical protein VMN36_02415 [Verrucomicrobiales bacterium]|nr:hypothetical protein [Verrucomicrobiales bacterium]